MVSIWRAANSPSYWHSSCIRTMSTLVLSLWQLNHPTHVNNWWLWHTRYDYVGHLTNVGAYLHDLETGILITGFLIGCMALPAPCLIHSCMVHGHNGKDDLQCPNHVSRKEQTSQLQPPPQISLRVSANHVFWTTRHQGCNVILYLAARALVTLIPDPFPWEFQITPQLWL